MDWTTKITKEYANQVWEESFQEWDEVTELRVTGGSMAVGVIDRVKSVKELIDEIIRGAEDFLKRDGPLKKL